jgi:ribosomal protein S19E (S16A)
LRAEPLIRPGSNSNKHSNSPSSLSSRNNRNSHLHNSGNVNREARQYLRSTGNVRQLNDRQLVNAIRQGRALLQQDGLRGRLQNQVRNTVQAATAERQRRQQAQQPQQPQQPPAGNSGNINREARQYLRSAGNVRQLNDGQLTNVIRQGRNLMQQDGLRGNLQRQVQNTVQAAVAERQRRQQQAAAAATAACR